MRLHETHGPAGLRVLGVNGRDQERSTKHVKAFLDEGRASFPVALDQRERRAGSIASSACRPRCSSIRQGSSSASTWVPSAVRSSTAAWPQSFHRTDGDNSRNEAHNLPSDSATIDVVLEVGKLEGWQTAGWCRFRARWFDVLTG